MLVCLYNTDEEGGGWGGVGWGGGRRSACFLYHSLYRRGDGSDIDPSDDWLKLLSAFIIHSDW